MYPSSIQLYTLRAHCAEDFFGVIRGVADIGYNGVEFAGLHGKKPSEVAAVLKETGLKASSSHVGLPTKENISQLVDTELALGNSKIIAGFGPNDFTTLDDTKRAAAKLQEGAAIAKANGLQFGMHNHWWEFDKQDSRYIYDILLDEAPDMFSELDVYWAAYGGVDPAVVVAEHKSRLPLLHIKDGSLEKNAPHLAVGSGKLDMPAIVGAADPNVLQWLIVELDECATDMWEAVRQSYRYLTSQKLASGNK